MLESVTLKALSFPTRTTPDTSENVPSSNKPGPRLLRALRKPEIGNGYRSSRSTGQPDRWGNRKAVQLKYSAYPYMPLGHYSSFSDLADKEAVRVHGILNSALNEACAI